MRIVKVSVLIFMLTVITGCSKTKTISQNAPITIDQLVQNVLTYNGKQVVVTGIVVDTASCQIGQTLDAAGGYADAQYRNILNSANDYDSDRSQEKGWFIADHVPSNSFGYSTSSGPSDSILFTPAPAKIEIFDTVLLHGTFDGEQKILHITSFKVTGHHPPFTTNTSSIQTNNLNTTTSSANSPTVANEGGASITMRTKAGGGEPPHFSTETGSLH